MQRDWDGYAASEQMGDVEVERRDEWAVNKLFDLDIYPVASLGHNGS